MYVKWLKYVKVITHYSSPYSRKKYDNLGEGSVFKHNLWISPKEHLSDEAYLDGDTQTHQNASNQKNQTHLVNKVQNRTSLSAGFRLDFMGISFGFHRDFMGSSSTSMSFSHWLADS